MNKRHCAFMNPNKSQVGIDARRINTSERTFNSSTFVEECPVRFKADSAHTLLGEFFFPQIRVVTQFVGIGGKRWKGLLRFLACISQVLAEGSSCNGDKDCPLGQYCYDTNSCANYTVCSRYNRLERDKPARQPSQCGPCMPG